MPKIGRRNSYHEAGRYVPLYWIFVSWLESPGRFKTFPTKTVTNPTIDIKLIQEVTNLMTREAMVIPVLQVGRGFGYQPYVKNAGWLERGISPYWKPEQAWLDK
jgi:hypothetical protein